MSNVTPWLLFQLAEDLGGFAAPWNHPEYALIFDALGDATSGPIGSLFAWQQTTPLRLRYPDLGGALPGAFLLRGVEIEFKGRWFGSSTGLRTVPASAVVGAAERQNLGSLVLSVGTPTTIILGGPTDTMGFSESDVVNPDFGFQLYGTGTTNSLQGNTLHVTSVRVRFYWDYFTTPVRGHGRSRAAIVHGIGL